MEFGRLCYPECRRTSGTWKLLGVLRLHDLFSPTAYKSTTFNPIHLFHKEEQPFQLQTPMLLAQNISQISFNCYT